MYNDKIGYTRLILFYGGEIDYTRLIFFIDQTREKFLLDIVVQ